MDGKQELVAMIMMTSGVLLWPLGGYRWKPFRRFVLPSVLFLLLLWYGVSMWQSFLVSGLLCGCAHLGYGSNTPWWVPRKVDGKFRSSKLLTALSYNLPALVLGWTWWFVLTPCVFLSTFALSNWTFTSKDFGWKVCEAIVGLTITATIIGSLQRSW